MSPPTTRTGRHLSAVWFADIVGYSRLAAANEPAAIRLVEAFQAVAREQVECCDARVVKFTGDGALAEFDSTESAVRAALALQKEFAARSAEIGMPSTLRIGVHVGDVLIAGDGDLYGDGVNVAARLQTEAEPGQVVVSEDIWRQLRPRPGFRFQPLGERELKGITARVAVFSVLDEQESAEGPRLQTTAVPAPPRPLSARPGPSRTLIAAGTGLFLLLMGVVYFARVYPSHPTVGAAEGNPEAIRSIAVLPFVNMSADAENEYFSDGLTEELLNVLAQVNGLRVAARTSSFQFKGKNHDIGEIGRKLNVESVLEGSVRKVGDRIRITAQLINVEDGYHLWSETYDRELRDIFAIQDEISKAIVGNLMPRLAGGSATTPVREPTKNMEAYELYLRGRHEFWKGPGEEGLRRTADFFEKAIDQDPSFALAYANLADAYMLLANHVPPRETMPKAKAAALKAIELDPKLAEGYVALASINWLYDWDWAAADRNYRRSFSVNPLLHTRCICYAWYLAVTGDPEAAVLEAERARTMDPLARLPMVISGWMYYFAGRYDDARKQVDDIFALSSKDLAARRIAAWIAWDQGRRAEAIAELEKVRDEFESKGGFGAKASPAAVTDLGFMYAKAGRRAETEQLLRDMVDRADRQYIPAENIAALFGALGDMDQAFGWLDRAYTNRSTFATFNLLPISEPLRSDPRYQEIMGKIGLDRALK